MKATVPLDRFTLEWMKIAVAQQVSAEFAADLQPEILREEVWGQLVYKLVGHILVDKLPPDVVTERDTFRFDIPASPWQQFKAVHADRWWMRYLVARRPVRMVEHVRHGELTVRLERFHAYPQAKVHRKLGPSVRSFMLTRETRWDES